MARVAAQWRRGLAIAGTAVAVVVMAQLLTPVVGFHDPLSTVLWSAEGELLGASIAADEQWRFPERREVPKKYALALLEFEDRRFYSHPGVDPIAVLRAMKQNFTAGRVVSGASTLTMQVVRMARKSGARTLAQKLVESWLALRLESARSKSDILALYASHAPFGGNVVGIDAAAWRYFGRAADRLSWAEAATLAVLPNNPALLHPGRHRQRLKNKRNALLLRLQQTGRIDGPTLELARAERLPPRPLALPRLAPHLLARGGREYGGTIRSTVRIAQQRRLTAIVDRHQRRHRGNHVYNIAALLLQVKTGAVHAYVGNAPGAGSLHQGDVDIVSARRSTGSLLKPFLYAGMLERGELLPEELVADLPTRIAGFSPENFDGQYDGAVPAAQALARSLNVPAVHMLYRHGVEVFYDELKAVGLTTLHRRPRGYGLSLVLGGAEGSMWEMTSAFAGLARRSAGSAIAFFPPYYRQTSATDSASARVLADGPAPPFGPASSYLTLQALTEVRRPGVETAWRQFVGGQPVSWKTGTSFGFRDAWAIGVTPNFAVGVWVGNATGVGRPGLVGVRAAAPILFEIFDGLDGGGEFVAPQQDMVTIEVCGHSGLRPGPDCGSLRQESVPAGADGGDVCGYCRRVHVARRPIGAADEQPRARGEERVHSGCQPIAEMVARSVFALPASMASYYRRRHPGYRGLPRWRQDCAVEASIGHHAAAQLACIYPKPGSQIFVPKELDGKMGRAVFQAQHSHPRATVHWHLDEKYLGSTQHMHQFEVSTGPGDHLLTLIDHQGVTVRRRFEVLLAD